MSNFLASNSNELPLMLYFSDVPPERSCHGSMLMFRLLKAWPAEKLRILLPNYATTQAEGRLEGVPYEHFFSAVPRLMHTRFTSWYEAFVARMSRLRGRMLVSRCRELKPDVILTVAHGHSWISAAVVADELGIPLIVIVHDDWPRCRVWALGMGEWVDKQMKAVLQQAASIFSVSPFMAKDYEQRYGCASEVLYPSRGDDCPAFDLPAPIRANRCNIAYAGSVASHGHALLLRSAAAVAAAHGGKLLMFSGLQREQMHQQGLDHPAIEYRGILPSPDMIRAVREEADFLYVAMSFAEQDAPNMEKCFPSKLTDYTAAGVPVLIHGPSSSSAVRWALERPGFAAVVTEPGDAPLVACVSELRCSPDQRRQLAKTAMEVGRQVFDVAVAKTMLQSAAVKVVAEGKAAAFVK